MHASHSNISLVSGRSDSDPLLSEREQGLDAVKAEPKLTDAVEGPAGGFHSKQQDGNQAIMSVADTALVSSTDASTAAYRKLPAAAATPAGNDLAAQSDQGHTVPDSPSSRTSDDSNSSSSDSSSTTQLQEQQHEHRKGVAAKPAGIDISQIDVADVAAAAAAQAAESPDSPKSVPIGVPIGQRVWTDRGINLQSRQSPLMEAFALVTMAIYLGFIHVLLLLLVGAFFSRTCLYLLLGIVALHCLPAKPLLWDDFLTNPVWRAWRRYFRFSVAIDKNFELSGKKYVIAEYPHGAFPLSQIVAVSLTDAWPGQRIYSLAADAVFYVPLWKHVMTWIGAQPATADNFRRLLKLGSVGLVPGGIAEMFMVEEDREVIKLRDRKGFVRIAVEMGADLVPCYHFGNTRLFGWGPKSLEPLARRHRVALGFLKGRWGLPFALPQRVPLMMVVGGPVKLKQTSPSDPDFAAVVDDAHAKLIVAMQELYDKYKAEYGWADRPLVIV